MFKPGTVVRHFKRDFLDGKILKTCPKACLYRVLKVAKHSETGELYYVYEPLYDATNIADCYIRPVSMFESDTDMEKYPAAKQKKRFMPFTGDEYYKE